MTTDKGKIVKVEGTWYVMPENMAYNMIELCPSDVRMIRKGYCLCKPNGLTVDFELIYDVRGKNYRGIVEHSMYARIT